MSTKAPKRALVEGLRKFRYLQGTLDVGLHFKYCDGFQDVFAYTDANFPVKRSQFGSVVKLGENVTT